jgi:nitroimidazol reductase NimA-like FMN-containing flavoprotein (pyridoxamine 5'-phosphate oxidase superfamily)
MPHAMRRTDREIGDPAHVESILTRGRFCTIALTDGEEPYAVTLSYGYDAPAGRLYFHVAHEGHKLDVIAGNPRTCATVVIDGGYIPGECEHPFESAVLRGTMRVVDDDAEKRHAIEVLVRHLEPDPEGYWASRSWALEERLGGFTALCLDIEEVTAKQGK